VTYVDFLMPGIIIQTSIFAALQTGVGLADDLQKGLIERFKSLPMARSAVLAGRTAADTVSVVFQIVLMVIVGILIGYRLHEGFVEAALAFLLIFAVGYTFTWVAAFAGLALKSVEAVQAATFTIVFPVIFVSSAFVPVDTMPSWIQPIARNNPMTIWVDTVRSLTLGDPFTDSPSELFRSIPDLGALAWQSIAWIAVILAIAVPVGVRMYRRT
jgi:ABC transporter DrrB family efflux protein